MSDAISKNSAKSASSFDEGFDGRAEIISAWNRGLARSGVLVMSLSLGKPAYGGTPSDDTVVRAVRDLKARGYAVVFYPFVFMDVPAGNALPNPYGGTGQPAHP